MWPFKKKASKPVEPNPQMTLVDQLMAWRAVGDEFTYLGRRMIVSGHYRIAGGFPFPMYVEVSLSADYADDNGVIRSVRFSAAESSALMQQQPNT